VAPSLAIKSVKSCGVYKGIRCEYDLSRRVGVLGGDGIGVRLHLINEVFEAGVRGDWRLEFPIKLLDVLLLERSIYCL